MQLRTSPSPLCPAGQHIAVGWGTAAGRQLVVQNPPKKRSDLLGKAGPTCSARCWQRGASTETLQAAPCQHMVALQHPGPLPMQLGTGWRSRESSPGTWVGGSPSHPPPWANSRGKGYAAGGVEWPLAGKDFIPSLLKTHLQPAYFSAAAPGPSASSSRIRRGLLGKSGQASAHPVKLEGFLFLLPLRRLHQQKRPSATSRVKTQRWAGERGRNICACPGHPGQNPHPQRPAVGQAERVCGRTRPHENCSIPQ